MNCPVCKQIYFSAQAAQGGERVAKIFTCGHTFCLGCIRKMLPAANAEGGAAQGLQVSCPTCKASIHVGPDPSQLITCLALLADQVLEAAAPPPRPKTVYCDICNRMWPARDGTEYCSLHDAEDIRAYNYYGPNGPGGHQM